MHEGWCNARLGDVVHLSKSRVDPRQLGDKLLTHFSIPSLDSTGLPVVEPASAIASHKFRVDFDSVLVSMLNPRIPRIWLARGAVDVVCSTEFAVLSPNTPGLLVEFLRLYCESETFTSELQQRAVGTTGSRQRTKSGELLDITLTLPPLDVQRRIVELVASMDENVLCLRREEQRASSMLNVCRTQLLRAASDGPKVRLGDIAECSWGNTSLTKTVYTVSGATAFSASGPDGKVSVGEMEGPAVILSAIGARCGGTWLADGEWTAIKNTIWFRSARSEVDTEFLYWASHDPDFFPKRGQAQPFISLGDVRAREVVLPSLAEQKRISTLLRIQDSLRQSLTSERERLSELRSSLLSLLLAGSIVVPSSFRQATGEGA